MSSATLGSPSQVCRVQQPAGKWVVVTLLHPVRGAAIEETTSQRGPPDHSLWGREGWLSVGSPCRTSHSQAECGCCAAKGMCGNEHVHFSWE